MATCFAAQSATHLLASSPTAAAVNNSCSPPQLLATGLQLESTQGLTRGLALAHGVKGSRSHRAGGEELPPFREKGKERERETISRHIQGWGWRLDSCSFPHSTWLFS